MFCVKLPKCTGPVGGPPVPWLWPEIKTDDERLRGVKSQIDAPYSKNKSQWERWTLGLEISWYLKKEAAKRTGAEGVTNAWLKFIELVARWNLLPDGQETRMFDNASAPGVFILAANYWTKCVNKSATLDWRASTLIGPESEALGDQYGLQKNYPGQHVMGEFNGDTTDIRYILHVGKSHGASFDLYTSDLGMAIPEGKYNCQEAVNARGNLGQVIMGLIVLKPGGNMVTKQFTHTSAFTQSIMAILTTCFREVQLCKPRTSKRDNSEEYLVCLGYTEIHPDLLRKMCNVLKESKDYDIDALNFLPPIIPESMLSPEFKNVLIGATSRLVDAQSVKILTNLAEYSAMCEYRKKNPGDRPPRPSRQFMETEVSKSMIDGFFKIADFRMMIPDQRMVPGSPR